MTKLIRVEEIRERDRKFHGRRIPGKVEEGAKAEIIPGESIRLFGERYPGSANPMPYDVTFKVGDLAEYDSWNLSYIGKIVRITEKTVMIEESHGRPKRKHRLSLHSFNWRNRSFDLETARKENAETMMHI